MGKTIGIDLGTTNSCMSVVENGRPIIIPNDKGTRTTPSIVAFTKDGERLVGVSAARQAAVNSERTVTSVKRQMGTNWHINIDGKNFSAQEISAMILRNCVRMRRPIWVNRSPTRSSQSPLISMISSVRQPKMLEKLQDLM